jgi:hypothetical protein
MNTHRSFIRILALFLIFLISLGVTQLTRFEHQITIAWNGSELTAISHNTRLQALLPTQSFQTITGSFQQSHWGEAGVSQVTVADGGLTELFSDKRPVLYLFGRSLWGHLLRGKTSPPPLSFDDWTAERHLSEPAPLYPHQLPASFTATLTVVGRGDTVIALHGADEYRINIRDGFIDNDASLSNSVETLSDEWLDEDITTNVRRITNFFAQMLCGGLALLILFQIVSSLTTTVTPSCTRRIMGTPKRFSPSTRTRTFIPASVLASAALSFALSLYFAYAVLGGTPHIPDSAVYYKQAILLAKGALSFPPPELSPLELFIPNGAVATPSGYTFHYNHFWPALLSVALKLNVAPALNPIFSALSVILLYFVARRFYDTPSAVVAAILSALSPFVIIMSGDFMTHTATYFLIVASLLLTLSYLNNPRWLVGISCGLTWGYALAIRPLSVSTIAAACAAYMVATSPQRALVRMSVAPILGLAAIASLYFVDNWLITGNPLISPYTAFHGVSVAPRNLAFGCNWMESTLGFLPQILFAPPLGLLVLSLSALTLIVERSRKEVFLFSILPLVVVAHCFYSSHGLHGYGPRFLFESLFAVFITAGRGAQLLWERASNAVRVLLIPVALLLIAYNVTALVKVLPSYRNYNFINSELASEIQKLKNKRAVVLAESATWHSLDVATRLFDPTFEDFIILGKDLDGSHYDLLNRLAGRPLYEINNDQLVSVKD